MKKRILLICTLFILVGCNSTSQNTETTTTSTTTTEKAITKEDLFEIFDKSANDFIATIDTKNRTVEQIQADAKTNKENLKKYTEILNKDTQNKDIVKVLSDLFKKLDSAYDNLIDYNQTKFNVLYNKIIGDYAIIPEKQFGYSIKDSIDFITNKILKNK